MAFYDRYLQLCEERDEKPYVVAVQLGAKSNSIVSAWKRGTVPKAATLQKIADYFNVSVPYLLCQTDDREALTVPARIPVYGSVPAGIPLEAIEDIQGWEEIPEKMLSSGKQYFGLIVEGDSMYPRFLPGDTIIVRIQEDCETGDDCVVYVNGYNATLKRVIKHGDGSLTLQPLNTQYAPRTFSSGELLTGILRIAGVVVELRRKMK